MRCFRTKNARFGFRLSLSLRNDKQSGRIGWISSKYSETPLRGPHLQNEMKGDRKGLKQLQNLKFSIFHHVHFPNCPKNFQMSNEPEPQ